MKITSYEHVNGHNGLIALLAGATIALKRDRVVLEQELSQVEALVREYSSWPWYKRLLYLRPWPCDVVRRIDEVDRKLKWLDEVKHRIEYQLTFEFDDAEAAILFHGSRG